MRLVGVGCKLHGCGLSAAAMCTRASRAARGEATESGTAALGVETVEREGAKLRLESRALSMVGARACVGVLLVRFGLVVVRVCARTTYVAYEAINTWLL